MEIFTQKAEVICYDGKNEQDFILSYPGVYDIVDGKLQHTLSKINVELGDYSVVTFSSPDPRVVKPMEFYRFFYKP